jgi:ribosomal protein L24
MEIKKGDKVMITEGPPNKKGQVGIVTILASNGVFITFPNGMSTAVKFNHLKKVV